VLPPNFGMQKTHPQDSSKPFALTQPTETSTCKRFRVSTRERQHQATIPVYSNHRLSLIV